MICDRLMFSLILLLLSIPGFILNTPMMIIGKIFNKMTPYQESKATHTLFTIIIFFPIVYPSLAFLLQYLFGIPFYISLFIFPILGVVSRKLLSRFAL